VLLQSFVVALLVTACAGYAAWTLAPASLRRALALALLKLPLPRRLSVAMQRQAVTSSSCACAGCDKAKAPIAATKRSTPLGEGGVAPLVFHPRPRQ
jgi:hypothetical protein